MAVKKIAKAAAKPVAQSVDDFINWFTSRSGADDIAEAISDLSRKPRTSPAIDLGDLYQPRSLPQTPDFPSRRVVPTEFPRIDTSDITRAMGDLYPAPQRITPPVIPVRTVAPRDFGPSFSRPMSGQSFGPTSPMSMGAGPRPSAAFNVVPEGGYGVSRGRTSELSFGQPTPEQAVARSALVREPAEDALARVAGVADEAGAAASSAPKRGRLSRAYRMLTGAGGSKTGKILRALAAAGVIGGGFGIFGNRTSEEDLPAFDPSFVPDSDMEELARLYDMYNQPYMDALAQIAGSDQYANDINNILNTNLAALQGYGNAMVPATTGLYNEYADLTGERGAYLQALSELTGGNIVNEADLTADQINAQLSGTQATGGDMWGLMPISGDVTDIPTNIQANAAIEAELARNLGGIEGRGMAANERMLRQLGPLAAGELNNRLALQALALQQSANTSIAEDRRAREQAMLEARLNQAGQRGGFLLDQAMQNRERQRMIEQQVMSIISNPVTLRQRQEEYLANADALRRSGIDSFTEYIYYVAESGIII